MLTKSTVDISSLEPIIKEHLSPYVKQIDQDALYAEDYLRKIGEMGFYAKASAEKDTLWNRIKLIEETAKVCMTTAFCVWCHLAAITYLTHTDNKFLRNKVLPNLLTGKLLAGTGLSNPLKSFAKLETIHLRANKVEGGYTIQGALPAVSNIGEDHGFAFIAELENKNKVMAFVYCNTTGLSLRQRTGYIGINGSATYSCTFKDVFIPDEQVIATNVDDFVKEVRTRFIAYQVPLGLGVTEYSIVAMERLKEKGFFANDCLQIQPDDIYDKNTRIRDRLNFVVSEGKLDWDALTALRLESVYLTLEAVQAAMLYHGGRGYVKASSAERKLREAYFLVNLTPTVKHLETLKQQQINNQ